MKYLFSIVLLISLSVCVLSQGAEQAAEHVPSALEKALNNESVSLRQKIRKMNMEFGSYAGDHVSVMNKLEADKLSLEKQIDDFKSRISDLDTKKTNNQKKLIDLRESLSVLKTKRNSTVAATYLKNTMDTFLFDYFYPFLFSILKFMDKMYTCLIKYAKYYWNEFTKTSYYEKMAAFISKWWSYFCQEFNAAVEYCISLVNQLAGFDTIDFIKKSSLYSSVMEGLSTLSAFFIPSNLYTYVDTFRLSLQMNDALSPYAEVIFYVFILIWILVPVTSLVTCLF